MRVLFGSIVLVAILTTGAVAAQERGGRPAVPKSGTAPPGKPPPFDIDGFFKDLDKNGDGFLQRGEFPPELRSSFDRIDANKDGTISRAELTRGINHLQPRRRASDMVYMIVEMSDVDADSRGEVQRAYDVLLGLDKNRDGKIDKAELETGRKRIVENRIDSLFQHLDANKDGKIGRAEAKGQIRQDFNDIDRNRDGFIDRDEMMRAATARPPMPPAGRENERRPAPKPRPRSEKPSIPPAPQGGQLVAPTSPRRPSAVSFRQPVYYYPNPIVVTPRDPRGSHYRGPYSYYYDYRPVRTLPSSP